MIFVLLFAWLFCAITGDRTCKFVLNEINADTPQQIETLEFIELPATDCQGYINVNMKGWRILFIKGMSTSSKFPEVEGFIEVPASSFKLTKDGMFVVGDKRVVPAPHVTFDNQNVFLRQKFYAPKGTILSFGQYQIANGNKVPRAVLLLKIDPTQSIQFHNYFQLGKNKQYVKITQDIISYLRNYAVDLLFLKV